MSQWIDITKKGEPVDTIDCCVIFYMDEYEFGTLKDGLWEVWINGKWHSVQESIRFYFLVTDPFDDLEVDAVEDKS